MPGQGVQKDLRLDAASLMESRPVDVDMAFAAIRGEIQGDFLVGKAGFACLRISLEVDPLSKGNHQSLFVEIACREIERVHKDIARISQVGDGGGEETFGREDGIIIPTFDAEALECMKCIEIRIFQVAIQEWTA